MSKLLYSTLLFAFGVPIVLLPALAAEELAVALTMGDASLQWGPCPEFLPKGCQIAVLHGDPGKTNADIFFKVPGKSKLPLHWHSSAERMVLVAGELHVTYAGQKTAVLKPGSYAYGPSKLPHSGVCASESPCVLFIAFEAPVDAVPVSEKPGT
jgi:quercetin dioxygenase-like cupin family protein